MAKQSEFNQNYFVYKIRKIHFNAQDEQILGVLIFEYYWKLFHLQRSLQINKCGENGAEIDFGSIVQLNLYFNFN